MPRLGRQPGRVLLLTCYDPGGISTVLEQVQQWALLSEFEIRCVNLMPTLATRGMRLPDPAVLDDVDAVILHPTVAYFPRNLSTLCEDLQEAGKDRRRILVLYKQDEHVCSHETAAIIGKHDIDLVLTCVSPQDLDTVYPRPLTGDVKFEHVYTGYFSEGLLRNVPRVPWTDRTLDFIYRGSKQPPSIGRLGFEKYALSRRLSGACEALGLRCDSSAEWADRIFGFDWIRSIADSRATVSLESGSNCFDFDGSIERQVKRYLEEHPTLDPWSDEGFEQLSEQLLAGHEDNVHYGQIAPRHFEAVAARTAQFLLPGSYSGLLKKDRHYLELQPDFSNFEECWIRLKDPGFRDLMIECAYEEIALRPDLQFKSLVQRVDALLTDSLTAESASFSPPTRWRGETLTRLLEKDGRPLILILCPHLAHLDPRIEWWRKDTFAAARVEVIEVSPRADTIGGELGDGDVLLSARMAGIAIDALPIEVYQAAAGSEALGVLCQAAETYRILTATKPTERNCTEAHLYLLQHMVRNSVGLIEAGARLRGVDGIVVADMPALPAGRLLSEMFDVPLIYDAQEVWAHSNELNFDEVRWWTGMEARLMRKVHLPVTVSPGIGEWFEAETGTKMLIVPNFVPCSAADIELPVIGDAAELSEVPIRFLFLGNFAPKRGLEQLIAAWDLPPDAAELRLQGPDNEFRTVCVKLARQHGKLDNGIVFPDAVDEDQLVNTASRCDVGLIPYVYPYPLSHCSPNKLGQYMLAGCAIFANRLPFVEECISEADCGLTANFHSIHDIRAKLREIVADRSRLGRWQANAQRAAAERYNWASAVSEVAGGLREAMAGRPSARFGVILPPRKANRAQSARNASLRIVRQSIIEDMSMLGHRDIEQLYLYFAGSAKRWLPDNGPVFRATRRMHRMARKVLRVCKRGVHLPESK